MKMSASPSIGIIKKHALKILLAGAGLVYFLPLGFRALWDSDEGRYAEIGREMLELKDWLSPHLNYVLYFEKPPLMYWLIALSEWVMGPTAFAARFWCPVFALLSVAVTYHIGEHWKNRRTGLLAGIILGSSFLFVALSQFLVLDMALTFWVTLELLAFSRLLEESSPSLLRRNTILAAIAAAGGTLTKGPVAIILPGAAFLAAVYVGKQAARFRGLSWRLALWTMIILTAPWFILVGLRHPFFVPFFFIREHLTRFFTNVHQRNQPVYFFIIAVAFGFLPWSVFLPQTLYRWISNRGRAIKTDSVGGLFVIWTGLIFVFFSLSHSKLVGYILPIFPPLSLLVADRFDQALDQGLSPKWMRQGIGILCLLFFTVLVVLKGPHPPVFLRKEPMPRLVAHSGLFVLTLVAGLMLMATAWYRRRARESLGAVVLFQMSLLVALLGMAPVLDSTLSTYQIAAMLNHHAPPADRIVSYGVSYENHLQTLVFYMRRRLVVMGDPGELEMGRNHDVQRADWFVSTESEQNALRELPARTWVVTNKTHWDVLKASEQSTHFKWIMDQGPFVLVQKSD